MISKTRRLCLLLVLLSMLWVPAVSAAPDTPDAGVTYYVSSSSGDDGNDGLSTGKPLASIQAVNALTLQPGDSVLFKCGDTWRAEMLVITQSGTEGNPITYGQYPEGCKSPPVLSGAQPVTGWELHSGNIYVAALDTGDNAGKFDLGPNQLFRDGERLTLGRWPNLDTAGFDSGYSAVDDQPAGNRLVDNELPAGDWSGAMVHIRGMRWYILNREVTGSSGTTLTLNDSAGCWDGDCTGWGYFINNHLATLDQDGEWYYDAAARKVYLYASGGSPTNIEGSVVLKDDDRSWGGITLGVDLGDHITDVVIENLDVRRWFRHGIATPTNLRDHENSRVVIRYNTIKDVDGVGINLATWVYDAVDGENGWRGGRAIEVAYNLIEGANHRGIDSYAKNSHIHHNTLRDIALVENLGASGMGCDTTASGGSCTEDGDGIRIKVGKVADSGNNNTIEYNYLENVGYNGMDIFGPNNTIAYNYILRACYSKGDCGGVRTYGSSNLSGSNVHDLLFDHNIIVDTLGNTDGCVETYKPLFGFGLYIDHYSRDVEITGNTIISSTVGGILYQNSTGSITGNTLYNNSAGTMYSAQVVIGNSPAYISTHTGNILYSLQTNAWTLRSSSSDRLAASDHNYFFNPFLEKHISANGTKTLAEWQSYSGMDGNSKGAWFSLEEGDKSNSRIFYNASATTQVIDLVSSRYLDLDQNTVTGEITLAPYTSRVLIHSGEVADLSLAMQLLSSSEIMPGELLTYTLHIANQGTLPAAGVVLTNTVPLAIVNTAWQASNTLAGITQQTGTRYVWNLPDIAAGAGGIITVTGTYTDVPATNIALALVADISTISEEADLNNNHAVLQLGTWHQIYLPLLVRN